MQSKLDVEHKAKVEVTEEANWMGKGKGVLQDDPKDSSEEGSQKLKQNSSFDEKQGPSERIPSKQGENPLEPLQCYICKEFEHHVKDCRRPWRCEKCGKPGHDAMMCTRKPLH